MMVAITWVGGQGLPGRNTQKPSAGSHSPAAVHGSPATFVDVIGFSAASGRFGCEVESPYQEGCHLSPGHSLVRAVT